MQDAFLKIWERWDRVGRLSAVLDPQRERRPARWSVEVHVVPTIR
jgi:hypothetical protein